MSTKPATQIGMREFMRTMKDIKNAVKNGEEFVVLDHARPVFKVVPIQFKKTKKYTFADLEKLQFTATPNREVNDIDEAVYGS
jgi:antitoxin (DNA-binding transcriptional repressor) of toxin-antitoxin stability system